MAPSWYSTVMNDLDISTQQNSQYLTSRSIFTRDDDAVRDSKDCARPIPTLVGDPLYANSDITFHQLAIYICIPCLALTTISTLLLCWRHIKNYTAPQEQRQILRIAALPVFLCLFNFLALCWYGTFQYIQPLAGLYQSFAIAALFFLLLEWVCSEGNDREKYFSEFPFKGKKGVIIEGGSLAWFERTWAQIFQYPLITLVFTIIEIVTQYYGKYCSNSFAPRHAHLWLFLASIIFVAGALEATGAFARRMSSEMSGTHKERAKIYSFLGIFFFQIIQGIIFSLLNGKLFSPTRRMTYNDINFGMPAFLTCLETLLFSLIFHWAYSAREFQTRPHRFLEDQHAPRLGTWRAVRDALDLSDVANAVRVALKFAWRGLRNWWNGTSTSRGPVGKVVDLVADAAAKRRDGSAGGDYESRCSQQGVSPFDDSMAVAGPAVPHAARDPAPPGRVRTFNGESALGSHGEGDCVPLRGNTSRDSSLSDRERSYSRR